jgi:hypothetical protein
LVTITNKNVTDMTLATQTNPPGTDQVQPYLGDYISIVGVGDTFYGVFAALNADNGTGATINPDNPTSVIFQRNTTGTPGTPDFQITGATNSIDPFFFKFTPPTAAPLVGVAQTPLDHAMV